MPLFSDLPRGTQVRIAAIAVLKSCNTLAGNRVTDSTLDPIDPAGTPAIIVTSSELRDTISAAGGRPAFRVAYTLRLQGIIVDADETACVLNADLLREQMLDALLEDPVWPSLVEAIGSDSETLWTSRTDARNERQTIVTINTAYRQTYGCRATSVLLPSGLPTALRNVAIAPLTRVVNTIDTGLKLEAGQQNSDSFQTIVALPQS